MISRKHSGAKKAGGAVIVCSVSRDWIVIDGTRQHLFPSERPRFLIWHMESL